jgi:cytidine deaminase
VLFDKDTKIISVDKDGNEKTYTLDELCPHPFNLEK